MKAIFRCPSQQVHGSPILRARLFSVFRYFGFKGFPTSAVRTTAVLWYRVSVRESGRHVVNIVRVDEAGVQVTFVDSKGASSVSLVQSVGALLG